MPSQHYRQARWLTVEWHFFFFFFFSLKKGGEKNPLLRTFVFYPVQYTSSETKCPTAETHDRIKGSKSSSAGCLKKCLLVRRHTTQQRDNIWTDASAYHPPFLTLKRWVRFIYLFLFAGFIWTETRQIVSESLKGSDPHMATLFWVVFYVIATAWEHNKYTHATHRHRSCHPSP